MAQSATGGDPFARYLGVELVEVAPGYAVARLAVAEHMLNLNRVTHGGAVFTLADTAFEAASNSHGPAALALNVNMSFVKASVPGDTLTATAVEENRTRRTGLYRIRVVDGSGGLVAEMTGVVYRKGEKAGPPTGRETGWGAKAGPPTGRETGWGAKAGPPTGRETGWGAKAGPPTGRETGWGEKADDVG